MRLNIDGIREKAKECDIISLVSKRTGREHVIFGTSRLQLVDFGYESTESLKGCKVLQISVDFQDTEELERLVALVLSVKGSLDTPHQSHSPSPRTP